MKGIQFEKTLPAVFLASTRPLRIAQIAPLYESVPPKLYGGTERVVAYLAEELVRRGHEVSLYASGDSTASVPLISGSAKRAWVLRPGFQQLVSGNLMKQLDNDLGQNNSNLRNTDQTDKPVTSKTKG